MMEFRKGNLDGARQQFIAARDERPDNPSIGLNLVQVALELCKRGEQVQARLYESDETLYQIQYAAMTSRQQTRYKSLSKRLTELVKKLA